jgi:hypothetical protein
MGTLRLAFGEAADEKRPRDERSLARVKHRPLTSVLVAEFGTHYANEKRSSALSDRDPRRVR